ncbi:MAG: zinc-binding dehydrogenase [Phycisphaerae bacterium]|nr:zinc-binding dehydrogenase [Phycisphaerae bacterium]
MKKTCNAAVFTEVGQPLVLRQFDVPETLEPGAALCGITMSTICGSDLHTIRGRRAEPAPLILGHEILGEIIELGEGLTRDGFGEELRVGDRVSWTIMACCGECFYCRNDLPQKCEHLRKYGHSCCEEPPHLTGGFAEYIYLSPGTTVFKVPSNVPDDVATPANCALATVVHAAEAIELKAGETVLIQGAGLLGLNLIALAKQACAKQIFVTDISPDRLAMAKKFGATTTLNVKESAESDVLATIREKTDSRGVDVAFEVCGVKEGVAPAIRALRIGGRYLIAGLVTPGANLGIDGNQVTRKCLTIRGIHNYKPRHLGTALKFLAEYYQRYPYAELVGAMYPLSEINQAVEAAESGKFVRVGIQ